MRPYSSSQKSSDTPCLSSARPLVEEDPPSVERPPETSFSIVPDWLHRCVVHCSGPLQSTHYWIVDATCVQLKLSAPALDQPCGPPTVMPDWANVIQAVPVSSVNRSDTYPHLELIPGHRSRPLVDELHVIAVGASLAGAVPCDRLCATEHKLAHGPSTVLRRIVLL